MPNIQTNTSLESVLDNKQDQLKLRDFNDLNKKDVITSVQRVFAYKSADDVEMTINASAEEDKLHYSLSKDEAEKIESKYKDRDSQEYASITDELEQTLRANLEDQIEIYSDYDNEVETEIEEISVDQLARRKYAYHSTRFLADQLIDHSEVDENNKNKVLNDLKLDKEKHAVELVLKDNVKTFVIVKKDKSIKDQIESVRDSLNFNFSDSLKSFKKIDEVMLELYDDERSIYESLKIFLERFDKEVNKDVLVFQEEDIVNDLRKLFKTLESQSENTSQ